jgi:hypothetical protein
MSGVASTEKLVIPKNFKKLLKLKNTLSLYFRVRNLGIRENITLGSTSSMPVPYREYFPNM